jgi:hypothetical protein
VSSDWISEHWWCHGSRYADGELAIYLGKGSMGPYGKEGGVHQEPQHIPELDETETTGISWIVPR